jgi:hypothetical protein
MEVPLCLLNCRMTTAASASTPLLLLLLLLLPPLLRGCALAAA